MDETVIFEDIKRACHLIQRSMREVGMDSETGSVDADIIWADTTQTQRQRRLQDLLMMMASDYDDGVPISTVCHKMKTEYGSQPERVQNNIAHPRETGEAYEPVDGRIRQTRQ